jgi:hypothetical protein
LSINYVKVVKVIYLPLDEVEFSSIEESDKGWDVTQVVEHLQDPEFKLQYHQKKKKKKSQKTLFKKQKKIQPSQGQLSW